MERVFPPEITPPLTRTHTKREGEREPRLPNTKQEHSC